MLDRIKAALDRQQGKTVTILSSLIAAQDEIGYLLPEALEAIAQRMGVTINDVFGVATFYPNFRFDPPGEHVVEVCWGPSCYVKGAASVLQAVQDGLGLGTEGTTPDRKVTLKYNTCLGACSQAPVMSVDHHLKGRLTPKDASRLAKQLDGHRPSPGQE